ncbi:MAG: hypothetical protein ACM33T_11155 [Solirubrobacterales bacterium]
MTIRLLALLPLLAACEPDHTISLKSRLALPEAMPAFAFAFACLMIMVARRLRRG